MPHYKTLRTKDVEDPEHLSDVKEFTTRATGSWISRWVCNHSKALISTYVTVGLICAYIGASLTSFEPLHGDSSSFDLRILRRWGGFEENPTTNRCYRQERVSTLLSLFLGSLAVDQWYAHHWVLAVFKMSGPWLAAIPVFCLDKKLGLSVVISLASIWSFVDLILWIVDGVYGTPGCPGGSKEGWRY